MATLSLLLLLLLLLLAGRGAEAGCPRCDHGRCTPQGLCLCEEGWQGDGCSYCGGKTRVSNSEITDGLGPYPAGTMCSWLVAGRQNATVRLLLEQFDMQCGSSHLYVHDGKGMDAPLIAVLTGVMHRNDHHISRSQEIITHSGYAFIHYTAYSDVNTSAFRISVRVGSCPRNSEGHYCWGHGRCLGSRCLCANGYRGAACDIEDCPKDCSGPSNGVCTNEGTCICKHGFTGEDCSQPASLGEWLNLVPSGKSDSAPGSASHAATLVGNTLYILGGESFGSTDLVHTYKLARNVWRKLNTRLRHPPAPRYGHTAVIHDDVIYMYGGALEKGRVSSDLWALNITSRVWENMTTVILDNCVPPMCGPIQLVGHSANVVFDEYMVVFFGYSPQYGIVNTVQEYHFESRVWKHVESRGYPVGGSYAHTSSWDPLSGLIYVLGGYTNHEPRLSNYLYSYEPKVNTWKMLSPAPVALYLHTATFATGGFMLVYGGNGRTDSPSSSCYSAAVLSYDAVCDQWRRLVVRHKPRRTDLARFGHSAFAHAGSLFIFAGYNGHIKSDMIRFTPGKCEAMSTVGECVDAKLGVKCVWNQEHLICQSVDSLPNQRDLWMRLLEDGLDDESFRYNDTTISAMREEVCAKLTDCLSCTSTSMQCSWLASQNCAYLGISNTAVTTSSEECRDGDSWTCSRYSTCLSCMAAEGCTWDQKSCSSSRNSEDSPVTCDPPCGGHDTCSNCTESGCIWCESDRRCVDPDAEVISYPYGQCMLWARHSGRCPAPGEGWCQSYLTCESCVHDPACGWCDGGPLVGGMGTCFQGGYKGTEADFCHQELWYFVDCPACQCNGHSNCTSNVCNQPCGDHTHGDHCEDCDLWFYGKPLNGRQCTPCNCSADATDCDPESGACSCATMGVVGDLCDTCDVANNYVEDPDAPGTCFYELPVNYQFTYNSSDDDGQFDKINFISKPLMNNINMTFRIECFNNATMNVTARTVSGTDKFLVMNHKFSADSPLLERKFRVKEDSSEVLWFRVQLSGVLRPAELAVSFSQAAKWSRGLRYAPVALSFSMFVIASALSSKYF